MMFGLKRVAAEAIGGCGQACSGSMNTDSIVHAESAKPHKVSSGRLAISQFVWDDIRIQSDGIQFTKNHKIIKMQKNKNP
jgi:hypothetical protein